MTWMWIAAEDGWWPWDLNVFYVYSCFEVLPTVCGGVFMLRRDLCSTNTFLTSLISRVNFSLNLSSEDQTTFQCSCTFKIVFWPHLFCFALIESMCLSSVVTHSDFSWTVPCCVIQIYVATSAQLFLFWLSNLVCLTDFIFRCVRSPLANVFKLLFKCILKRQVKCLCKTTLLT